MTDELKPALTTEEWSGENNVVLSTASTKLGYFVAVDRVDDGLELSVVGPTTFVLPPDDLHRIAAYALYGQPFGFTREALDALRRISEGWWLHEDGRPDDREQALRDSDALVSIIATIASLLPPEGA